MVVDRQFVSRISLRRDQVESFERYPFCVPAVRHLETLELHPKLTIFVGENGSGKSTLLEALAVSLGFIAEGGSKNFRFDTRASHSDLDKFLRVAKGVRRPRTGYFLRAESFFNVATELERLDADPSPAAPILPAYGGRSLHEQSHGESFFALMTERFRGDGLYILDEPEAALSPQRQLAVLSRIHDLAQDGAQFVIATHSPILMAYPDATLYQFGADGIKRIGFEDTEHFRVTRRFVGDPHGMLRMLLGTS
jgi:predicted ATPase